MCEDGLWTLIHFDKFRRRSVKSWAASAASIYFVECEKVNLVEWTKFYHDEAADKE